MRPASDVISLCKEYMDKDDMEETPLGSYLTKYALIHICAEYEREIKDIVIKRAAKSNDDGLVAYVERRVDIRDLCFGAIRGNILKPFKVNDTHIFDGLGKEIQAYNNLVTNRNEAAHGGDIRMSFSEVVSAYEDSKRVLCALSDVVNP